jgi:uncharacterized membrane protein
MKPETRWLAPITVAITMAVVLSMPDHYQALPAASRLPFMLVALALLVIWSLPSRGGRESRIHAMIGPLAVAILAAVIIVALTRLIGAIVFHSKDVGGIQLLSSALTLWLANSVTFGIWFWLIDRGGPDARATQPGPPELFFPQMQIDSESGWQPRFFDYIYVAFTNSTAFSPTDTLPLSRRMKAFMLVQSLVSLLTIAMVAARAVNILA